MAEYSRIIFGNSQCCQLESLVELQIIVHLLQQLYRETCPQLFEFQLSVFVVHGTRSISRCPIEHIRGFVPREIRNDVL